MYSSITVKKCHCGCGRYPSFNCAGYYYECMPQELKDKRLARKKDQIKRRNVAKVIASKLRMDNYKNKKHDSKA